MEFQPKIEDRRFVACAADKSKLWLSIYTGYPLNLRVKPIVISQ